MTTQTLQTILDNSNLHCRESVFDHLVYLADGNDSYIGAIDINTHELTGYDSRLTFEIIAEIEDGLTQIGRLIFADWLTDNYEYSGDVDNGKDNAWLSKSDTDYNIYFESVLKKEYSKTHPLLTMIEPNNSEF